MYYILTIAIPTFNRASCVINRLRELLPQCSSSEIEILIVDNASDDNVEQYVSRAIPEASARVKFHRNRANIGLAANICRCYELSQGKWIWTLGDDDAVCSGAVASILNVLREEDEKSHIGSFNFSTGIHQYAQRYDYSTIEAYWAELNSAYSFSNSLFISSCIVRTSLVLSNLRVAYQQIFSAAPQIAVVIAGLKCGYTAVLIPTKIVEWTPPARESQWNLISVIAGLPVLAEIHGSSDAARQNLYNGISLLLPTSYFRTGIKSILLDKYYDTAYWEVYFMRLCSVVSGITRLKTIMLCTLSRICWKHPKIHKFFAMLILKYTKTRPDNSIGLNRL